MTLRYARRSVSHWMVRLALITAFALTGLMPLVTRADNAPAPPAQPPSSTTATPVAATTGTDTMTSFLALAPDILATNGQNDALIMQFGDAKAQLDAVGMKTPATAEGNAFRDWMSATRGVALPDLVLRNGLRPEFSDAFGFDLLQVDAGMVVGAPPATITYLRGRFDEDTLRSAWQKSGYKEVDAGGQQVFSLSAEPTVSLDNPIGQMALAAANNAAILPDGTVVFTPSLDLMRQVVAVVQGAKPSLAQNPQIGSLVSSLAEPLVSAFLLGGNALTLDRLVSGAGAPPEVFTKVKGEVEATGKLAPVKLALFGVTAGGPLMPVQGGGTPIATERAADFVIELLMADQQAAQAATQIIPKRLASLDSIRTRQPYTDLVTLHKIDVAPDAPVVAIHLDFAADRPPATWTTMVSSNDLLFLAWEA
ncbi:MAG TPA: hypothetical protein VFL82_11555 [Thermomicrobiales bacterium]|nr:hypothetical protein [Thermomicrobiales bacterium]